MRPLRTASSLPAIAASLALLAGCAVATDDGGAFPDLSDYDDPATASPQDYAPHLFQGTVGVTDDAGYTFDLTFDLGVSREPYSRIADEAPGFTTVVVPVESSLVAANTTDGRNLDLETDFLVVALFPESSALCSIERYELSYLPAGKYCGIYFAVGSGLIDGVAALGPDESSANLLPSADVELREIPEALAESIMGDFRAAEFVLARMRGSGGLGCDFQFSGSAIKPGNPAGGAVGVGGGGQRPIVASTLEPAC